jgi:hypothetical protein
MFTMLKVIEEEETELITKGYYKNKLKGKK